ncbi:MAG TPA: phosphomannomutase/phosphoglucomutase [Lachnoclostridium sp.]|nr:phosphomannomutase/phosphoglucomutase [Lachnoclostridium sp.]
MSENNYLQYFKKVQNGNDVRGAAIATDKEALTISEPLAAYIARAFASYLSEKLGKPASELRIGVGHDSRMTAPQMKAGCLLGLSMAKAYDCGLITTPAMFCSTVLPGSNFDGAVMITASHLPFNRNGMKFFTKDGALSKAELTQILEQAAALAGVFAEESPETLLTSDKLPVGDGTVTVFDMKSLYCEHMKEIIRANSGSDEEKPLTGLRIAVDSGNGASGFFASDILEPLGADTEGSQFLNPDGTFPNHVPNPEDKTAMEAIQKATLEHHADLGVIFDCDGDRAAVVFSDGMPVNRNTLIALLGVIVAEQAPGSTVVTDSVTSDELAEFLEGSLGLKHLRFKRGYKNVIDKGIELNAAGETCELAIETSGHGAFKENYFSDDGAYIAAKIIGRMARIRREGKTLESLIADLRQPAEAAEMRLSITAENFKAYGQQVLEDFRTFCAADPRFHIVSPNYEGVRVAFDDEEVKGWLLIRLSLHDPVIPINLESANDGGVDILKERIRPFIEAHSALQ